MAASTSTLFAAASTRTPQARLEGVVSRELLQLDGDVVDVDAGRAAARAELAQDAPSGATRPEATGSGAPAAGTGDGMNSRVASAPSGFNSTAAGVITTSSQTARMMYPEQGASCHCQASYAYCHIVQCKMSLPVRIAYTGASSNRSLQDALRTAQGAGSAPRTLGDEAQGGQVVHDPGLKSCTERCAMYSTSAGRRSGATSVISPKSRMQMRPSAVRRGCPGAGRRAAGPSPAAAQQPRTHRRGFY